MPKISVVMAVYNGSAFISEAVQSILDQTFTDFEFIIVDDASTDDTGKIICSFHDDRLVYLKLPINAGQTPALNQGIKAARGEFIARIDADDIAMPGRFKAQVEFLDAHPDVAVLGTWQETMDVNGNVIGLRRFPLDPWDIKAGLVTASPMGWFNLSHPTVMIRKAALEKVGYFDESFRICQDYDLWVRMSRTYVLANIPYVGLKYRFHGQSLSQKNIANTKMEIRRVIQKNIDRHLTQVTAHEKDILVGMLLFDPPVSGSVDLGKLFDRFFDDFMRTPRSLYNTARASSFSRVLQAYYAPQWIKKDLKAALKSIIHAVMHQPGSLFSKRFAACVWYSVWKKW